VHEYQNFTTIFNILFPVSENLLTVPCNLIVGNVGSNSARHVAEQMRYSTQQMNDAILHATGQMRGEMSQATQFISGQILRATKDVTSSINSAATTLQFNISSLEQKVLVGALIIGASISLFALVHAYTKIAETQIVYVQSTIEIEEADGKKTKSHVVVQGPASVVREHLQGAGIQLRALVDESVGARVHTQQRHVLQTSGVRVRIPSLVTGQGGETKDTGEAYFTYSLH